MRRLLCTTAVTACLALGGLGLASVPAQADVHDADMSMTSDYATPGEVISARSLTPCPTDTTDVAVFITRDWPDDVAYQSIGVGADFNWSTQIQVPATLQGTYWLEAGCYNGGFLPTKWYGLPLYVITAALTATTGTAVYGQPVTFRASYPNPTIYSNTDPVPYLNVSLADGSTVLDVGTTGWSYPRTYTTAALEVGSHAITATFSMVGWTQSHTLDLVVSRAPTSLSLGTVKRALKTTFSATLTSPYLAPAGQPVIFRANGPLFKGVLCTGTTNASGITSCVDSNLIALTGTTNYTASYTGNYHYLGSSSSGRIG